MLSEVDIFYKIIKKDNLKDNAVTKSDIDVFKNKVNDLLMSKNKPKYIIILDSIDIK